MSRTIACVLLGLSMMPAAVRAQHFSSTQEILAACTAPMPDVVSEELLAHLRAGVDTTASMPAVSCIAVLFGSSLDQVLSFAEAKNRSYFVVRIQRPGVSEPSYEFSQTPVTATRKLVSGWDVKRWEFDSPQFKITEGIPLSFRRVAAKPLSEWHTQTIRVARVFPITQGGQTVDRLHVLIDDWGKWRGALERPERKWHIYSERANAVVLSSVLYTDRPNQIKWESTNVNILLYIKGDKVDLMIDKASLAPLRDFMKDFDVWSMT